MRAFLTAFILLFLTVAGRAETINVPGGGKLTLYPVGDWKLDHADQGDLLIKLTPKDQRTNAGCQLILQSGVVDEFDTKDKLAKKVGEMGRQTAAGQGMGKPSVKAFNCSQGFGFFFTLVDPTLVGKPPEPGNYKQMTVGVIRLAPGVMVEVQLLSDGDRTEAHQQLLGTVEGMELKR